MSNTAEGAKKVAAARLGIPIREYLRYTAAGYKWCWRCRNWILRSQFSVDRSRSDGLTSACSSCRRVKNRRQRTPTASPSQMQGAHDAVRHAIRRGRLARPTTLPCLDCGKRAAHYHHHRGYAREAWLDVVALCRRCHPKRHWLDEEEETGHG